MTLNKDSIKKFNLILILFLIFVLPPLVYFYTTRGYNTFSKLEIIGKEGHKIPDFSFINQNNEIIVSDSLNGYIYIANFFFTSCPTICPVMTKNMAYLQKKLRFYPHIKFLSKDNKSCISLIFAFLFSFYEHEYLKVFLILFLLNHLFLNSTVLLLQMNF